MIFSTFEDNSSILCSIAKYTHRDCLLSIIDYLTDDDYEHVLGICGLRSTGKRTLIYQAIAALPECERVKAFEILVTETDSTHDIVSCITKLATDGCRYVIINEASRADDFMECASLYADTSVKLNRVKVIFTGTDSLSFHRVRMDELDGRMRIVRTTYMPYREWVRLSERSDLVEFLRHGVIDKAWLPSAGSREDVLEDGFANTEACARYVATAIALNIQNTLHREGYEHSFGGLRSLMEADELVSAIQRVVQDINHDFGMEVLATVLASEERSLAKEYLATSDIERRSLLLKRMHIEPVIAQLRENIHIINPNDAKVKLEPRHVREILEYLKSLDIIVEAPARRLDDLPDLPAKRLLTLPGLRYTQTMEFLKALLSNEAFMQFFDKEKTLTIDHLESAVKYLMLEDTIILDSLKASDGLQVFKYRFDTMDNNGIACDMVIRDPDTRNCAVIKISHTVEPCLEHNEAFRGKAFNKHFREYVGAIKHRIILYEGDAGITDDGVRYINYETWLLSLDQGVRSVLEM